MSDIPTLRSCIIAEQDYTFISLDANQIELRVLAILSQDPQLLADLQTTDLHLASAVRMFGWSDDEDEMKIRRYNAKQVNFATVYDAGAFQLATMMGCSEEEALQFMTDHKRAYPKLYEWKAEQVALAKENGYVVNMFGRIRPLPELYAGSWKMREKAEKEVVNTLCQGTAVDIVKLAMIQLRRELNPRIRFILQVHDEILLEVPDELVEQALSVIAELPQYFPDYPFTASVGTRYSDLKEVE